MDSILNSALAEICSELQNGLPLQTLWPRLDPSLSSSNLDLSPHFKQALWDALRSVPTLKFDAKNAPYGPADPSILSFEDAEKLNLKLVADEGLRDNFMGLYNVRSANASLSKIQRMALERLVTARFYLLFKIWFCVHFHSFIMVFVYKHVGIRMCKIGDSIVYM